VLAARYADDEQDHLADPCELDEPRRSGAFTLVSDPVRVAERILLGETAQDHGR
jgi:hypothetical protein